MWKQLRLDQFFEQPVDGLDADVPLSRVAAVVAINRLCAPGSELATEQRWYPATALDDLLEIEEGRINDTRLYRCLDQKTKLERHLKQRYGELFAAEFDVLHVLRPQISSLSPNDRERAAQGSQQNGTSAGPHSSEAFAGERPI